MKPATIDELRKVFALSELPDDHLQWILERSELTEYADGDVIAKYGEVSDRMIFILEGGLDFYMNVNGRQVFYLSFKNDEQSGGVTGLLPFSRMKIMPGYAYATGPTRGISLNKKYFQELERMNPDLIQRLIGYMTERARFFATTQLQQEKVSALGKLAAGIAHELNNPAAAINRISAELSKRLNMNYELTGKLLHNGVQNAHIQRIRQFIDDRKESPAPINKNAMHLMEIEDKLSDWFGQHRYTEARQASETFAEAGITAEDLNQIMADISEDSFIPVIDWFENLLSSRRIVKDLEEASVRISNLVGAVKSHVQMDRTNELQATNIHSDIENTLTLLGYKLRDKNIKVRKSFCDDLPEVPAFVGELNQVWTNIIDNAIYAMEKNGELTIETSCNTKNVNIKIVDNGSGIPPEIISRIFDPFFTTKKVGEGTGIGLDLVNRIIKHHQGEIKVNSKPGRTEFDICIPKVTKN
jgi:signal transduction histidine kinase